MAAGSGISPLSPGLLIRDYKTLLLTQYRSNTAKQQTGNDITIHDSETSFQIRIDTNTTAAQLIRAETPGLQWGEYLRILDIHQEPIDDQHTLTSHTDICLHRHTKRSRTEQPSHDLVLDYIRDGKHHLVKGSCGDMHFQHLAQLKIDPPYQLLTRQGEPIPADTKVHVPGIYFVIDAHTFPTLPRLRGTGPNKYGPECRDISMIDADGLSDLTIHKAALHTFEAHEIEHITFWPPKFIYDVQNIQMASAQDMIINNWNIEHTLCGVIWDDHHWISFVASVHNNTLYTIVFDSLERKVAGEVERLFNRIQSTMKCDKLAIDQYTAVVQHHGAHCGTIALLNILQHTGTIASFSERDAIQWYHQLRDFQRQQEGLLSDSDGVSSTESFTLTGTGPQHLAALTNLLEEKGVPKQHASTRAQHVVTKLGWQTVEKALQDRNPWASLKQNANRPGVNLRLLTEEEQRAFIEARAASKHGAQIRDHKQKKNNHSKANKNAQPVITPEHLTIDERHFKDENNKTVPQIGFHAVAAEQRGLAICSLEMAQPFLQSPKSISTHALGLLILDPPAEEMMTSSGALKMRFPAKCSKTDECLLIYGCLLNLGDSKITRKMNGPESQPDTIKTCIVKTQVFRDQLQENWAQFVQAPVRRLIQLMPSLTLCEGQNCGADCVYIHAALDQPLDTVVMEVWGRMFSLVNGGKRPADQAEVFSVYLRVPEIAIDAVAKTCYPGIYTDPRQADIQQPHDGYSVIWLSKATPEEAAHMCKTNTYALALVRARNRYGIRVAKANEEKAWLAAKPGIDYQPVKTELIYEIQPIPHGTLKKSIARVLSDWGWRAKPLQPSKGTSQHMIWKIGAEGPPPSDAMQAFGTDIVINQIKSFAHSTQAEKHIAPHKTQQYYKQIGKSDNSDPWTTGNDPWSRYVGTQPTSSMAASSATPAPRKHLDDIAQALRTDLEKQLQQHIAKNEDVQMTTDQEQKLQQLESTIVEMQHQNQQFQNWFQEAGAQMKEQQQNMSHLRQEIKQVQDELPSQVQAAVHSVKGEIAAELQKTFESSMQMMGTRLEALLEKKQRHE